MLQKLLVGCALVGVATAGVSARGPAGVTTGSNGQRLTHFVGTWRFDGTLNAGPGGPGAAIRGRETCRMPDAVQLICDAETVYTERSAKATKGFVKSHATITYDPDAKQYRAVIVTDSKDDDIESAEGTYAGKTWTWKTEMLYEGRRILTRRTITELTPRVHRHALTMSQDDGKTWITIMEGKAVKQ